MNTLPGVVEKSGIAFNERSLSIFKEKNLGKKVRITVEKSKKTHSQNAFLHVLFQYIADETGHSKEEVKTIEKRRHLSPKEVEMFGKTHLVLPSCGELTLQEESELIERVLADCADLGIVVPDRSELGYLPG